MDRHKDVGGKEKDGRPEVREEPGLQSTGELQFGRISELFLGERVVSELA